MTDTFLKTIFTVAWESQLQDIYFQCQPEGGKLFENTSRILQNQKQVILECVLPFILLPFLMVSHAYLFI